MVENVEPTFSIMELFKDQIKVKGYGAEPSRELKLKSKSGNIVDSGVNFLKI